MRFCSRIAFHPAQAAAPHVMVERRPTAPKLRERWPFLGDPATPVELQALVTRRITRWHEYDELYRQLRDCGDIAELSNKAGQLLESYLDAQAIARELDYYEKHRRVLGRHPMFRHFQQLARLRSMGVRELIREQEKVKNNIWRVGSEIRKGTKPHLDTRRQQKLQEYQMELNEINRLLGDE